MTDYETGHNDVNEIAKRRVLRGGAFFLEKVSASASYRSNNDPFNRFSYLGFRVVSLL